MIKMIRKDTENEVLYLFFISEFIMKATNYKGG